MKPREYKEDEFIHFLRKRNGEYAEGIKARNDSTRKNPKHDMYEVPFHEIENIRLDKSGESIPYSRNNVVNLERYMLRYWQPIIGSDAIMLYLNLWEYCNRDENVNICYPKIGRLAKMMGRSKPVITKNLQILEDNNFIIIIYRLNKLSNNRETSPIFLLRETIPLLSIKQYQELPKELQEKHDDYMDKFGRDEEMDYFAHDSHETFIELASKGDKMISKKARERIEKVIQEENDNAYLLSILPSELRETMKKESFVDTLEQFRISKPSIDVFFKDAIVLYHQESLTVDLITKTKDNRDLLKQGINNYITDAVNNALKDLYGNISEIKYYTVEQYIYKLLKDE